MPPSPYSRYFSYSSVTIGSDGTLYAPTYHALFALKGEFYVSRVSPTNGATRVGTNTTISIVFSDALDQSSLTASNVQLLYSGGAVATSLGYDSATKTVTITPTQSLQLLTAYTVRLSTALKSTQGVPLLSEYAFSFLTAGANEYLWQEFTWHGMPYRLHTVWSAPLSSTNQARLRQTYLRPASAPTEFGASLTRLYALGGGDYLVTDAELNQERLVSAQRLGFYRYISSTYATYPSWIQDGDLEWSQRSRDNWLGNGLAWIAEQTGNPPAEPPETRDVYKAIIATAMASNAPPDGWLREYEDATERMNLVVGAGGTVESLRSALADEGYIRQLSSRAAKVNSGLLKALNLAMAGRSVTAEAMRITFTAHWQASVVAEHRDYLISIAQDDTGNAELNRAIWDLVNFDEDALQQRLAETFARSINEEILNVLRDLLKDTAGRVNPLLGAVLTGLDIGFFIASFTGWDHLRADSYQAADQGRVERAFLRSWKWAVASLLSSPTPDLKALSLPSLVYRLRATSAAEFYTICVEMLNIIEQNPSPDWLMNQFGYHSAKENKPTWAAMANEYRDRAGDAIPESVAATLAITDLVSLLLPTAVLTATTLQVSAYSPVDLLVTDPQGRQVGYNVSLGQEVNQVPEATYSGRTAHPEVVRMPHPGQGSVRVEATGTSTGAYTITVQSLASAGEHLSGTSWSGQATRGQTYRYLFDSYSGGQVVPRTVRPPITSASLSGSLGSSGWYTSNVAISLTPIANVYPVSSTEYSLDGGTTWITYTQASPSVSPLNVTAEGVTVIKARSKDSVGNVEEPGLSIVVRIDKMPPVTSALRSGTQRPNGSYTLPYIITLQAADNLSGVAPGRGTRYSLDNGATWRTYFLPFSVNTDQPVLFRSTDEAGNLEGIKSVSSTQSSWGYKTYLPIIIKDFSEGW